MSGSVSVILLIPRYLMIMGFALLAIYFFKVDGGLEQMTAVHTDFETILPHLITKYVPVGLAGLLLAGLLSAFMSTFASTVNAAPAYVVNDIYLKYINQPKGFRQDTDTGELPRFGTGGGYQYGDGLFSEGHQRDFPVDCGRVVRRIYCRQCVEVALVAV